jgi:hypothetical protein
MDSTHLKYGGWYSRQGLETALLSARQGRGLAPEQPAAHIAYISIMAGPGNNLVQGFAT